MGMPGQVQELLARALEFRSRVVQAWRRQCWTTRCEAQPELGSAQRSGSGPSRNSRPLTEVGSIST